MLPKPLDYLTFGSTFTFGAAGSSILTEVVVPDSLTFSSTLTFGGANDWIMLSNVLFTGF